MVLVDMNTVLITSTTAKTGVSDNNNNDNNNRHANESEKKRYFVAIPPT